MEVQCETLHCTQGSTKRLEIIQMIYQGSKAIDSVEARDLMMGYSESEESVRDFQILY